MREFVIREDTLNKILSILGQLPYNQVAQVIADIQSGVVLVENWMSMRTKESERENT